MQTQGGVAADDAILASTRRFRHRLRIDWNGDGLYAHALSELSKFVQDAEVDRALKGSAPENVMLIEGSSAAQLKFTLAGTDVTSGLVFPAVFSPYNGLSPLYLKQQIGAEVLYDIGVDTVLGTVFYPQFVGNLSTITPNRTDGEVHFTALDRVEKLRKPVTLAPWAVSDYWNNLGRTVAQRADTTVFIDACLQQCNVSSTKYRPSTRFEMGLPDSGTVDGVGVFVSGNNGIMPTIGWVDNAQAVTYPTNANPMYQRSAQPHPNSPDQTNKANAFAAMGSNTDGNYLRYWVANRDLTKLEGSHFFGFVFSTAAGFPNSSWHVTAPDTVLLEYQMGGNWSTKIRVQNNQMWLTITNGNTATVYSTAKVNIPSGQESVEVYATVCPSYTFGSTAYIRVGSNSSTFGSLGFTLSGTYPFQSLQGLLEVTHRVAMFDICYSFRNFGQTSLAPENNLWRQASYAAVLDTGLNTLSFNPGVNGQDAWEVITDLAAAEFGSVFWDENGVFRFWNYSTVKAKQDITTRSIGLKDVSGLEISNSLDSVRNIYSVQATSHTAQGAPKRIFEATSVDQFMVPGGTTKDFILFIDDAQFSQPFRLPRRTVVPTGQPAGDTFAQWSDQWTEHAYNIQFLYGDGWREPNFTNVTLNVYTFFNDQGQLILRVQNNWTETSRFAVGNGPGQNVQTDNKPALRIDGTKINKGQDVTFRSIDSGSVGTYGPRNFEAKGDWYQQSYADEGLMSVLIPRTAKPIPTTQNVEIPGDPRLQLADTLGVLDPDGLGDNLRMQIFGINRKLARDGGLTDTLSVELLRPPGQGIWDSSQYGRWDQSLVWN